MATDKNNENEGIRSIRKLFSILCSYSSPSVLALAAICVLLIAFIALDSHVVIVIVLFILLIYVRRKVKKESDKNKKDEETKVSKSFVVCIYILLALVIIPLICFFIPDINKHITNTAWGIYFIVSLIYTIFIIVWRHTDLNE